MENIAPCLHYLAAIRTCNPEVNVFHITQ